MFESVRNVTLTALIVAGLISSLKDATTAAFNGTADAPAAGLTPATVGGVMSDSTVRVVFPEMLPKVAEMVVVPPDAAVASPVALMVARAVADDAHVT